MPELVRQRVYGLALGYEDLNDHNTLRHDPLLAVAVTTLLSWATGFERNVAGQASQVKDPTLAGLTPETLAKSFP